MEAAFPLHPLAALLDLAGATASRTWTNANEAFWRGLIVATTVPGLILFASCLGFGALARDAGFSLANSVFMMASLFALPAQVVLADQLARGGSLLAGALAVSLTGIRMLPMVVTLMPYLRAEKQPGWRIFLAVHAIAITAWIEGMRRLNHVPERFRLTHFLGIGLGLIAASMLGTATGHIIAGQLPKALQAALLFLTPVYFMISLLATAGVASDRLSILCGSVIGPVTYIISPDIDLLTSGLVGGTIAHFAAKRWRITVEVDEPWEEGRGG